LIKASQIADDGGAFFGWGVEQGHLGKTEIFCKFNPQNAEAKAAVEGWQKEQNLRAFEENYFASTMGPQDKIGPALLNYNKWWGKVVKAIDPNGVSPEGGSLV